MYSILAATVTFFYTVSGTTAHQACYQKVGSTPTCLPIVSSATTVSDLDDDADYDFWAKVGGVDSIKTRVRTQKKTVPPPAIVIAP